MKPKTELELFKETMGDKALIQLRQDRRREKDEKRETRMIKSMVMKLDLGNQIEKTLPDQMSKIEIEFDYNGDDTRNGYFCYQNDVILD